MIKRAYSTIVIKAVDDEKRIIEGVASTPTPDRENEVIVPEGITFKLPLPLLRFHKLEQPIGTIFEAKSSPQGFFIKAQLPGPGILAYVDETWAQIKAGLIRGLSIRIRSLQETWDKAIGGYRYLVSEALEVSVCTIPANIEANITAVKSFDQGAAATGQKRPPVRLDAPSNPPGVSGQTKSKSMKTIQEQIASFEAKRAAHAARMTEVMNKSGEEGRTLDETETQEYDGLQSDVKSIDEHLVRLHAHEQQVIATATPVTEKAVTDPQSASRARGGIVTVKSPELPKGTMFTRYAIALLRSRGNLMQAVEIAKAWKDTTPQVEAVLKAAVTAGSTTETGWAAELADYTYMASEFIEFLRPMTIIGRIPGLRRVPFNIKVPLQDAGSTVGWVGEGLRKPVSKLHFDTATLRFAKAAGIVVLTDELVRFSNPSAEALVRDDLAAAIAQFLDEQFINPTVAAVLNVSPSAVTFGAGTALASGTDADAFRADFRALLAQFLNANVSPSGAVWVMQPIQAVAFSLMLNALGQKEFPSINADGGTLEGYPVVTSNSVPSGIVVFLKPSEIFLADDGGITLDASREASLVMDDGGSPNVTTMVSLWQNNMVGLRVERVINWQRRRDEAVYYLSSTNYGGGSPA
jgi:HK97 family phage major capsid protein/HK97 family phage prohead protease